VSSVVALVGRALMCAIFVEAGLGKLMSPAAYAGVFGNTFHLPMPWAAVIIAIIVEIGGGLAILIGFETRIVAGLLALYCIATAFIGHYEPGNEMQMINFMKNLCMAGGFLQLVAFGPGRYRVRGD
jgi:putative oxidoreductase